MHIFQYIDIDIISQPQFPNIDFLNISTRKFFKFLDKNL